MSWEELQKTLDDIIIEENTIHHLIASREPNSSTLDMFQEIDNQIFELAKQLTSKDLDMLENSDEGYEDWLLRLAPIVEGEKAKIRAKKYLNDTDSDVRKYAQDIMDKPDYSIQ